jgi:hypothetical protein
MANPQEAVDLLRSIDSSLKVLLRHFAAAAPKAVASDRELDGTHGDPVLRFTVRDWTGPSYKGRRFSECPADLLDLVASSLDYFAQQAEQKNEQYKGKPIAPYKRSDAARARGWAARIRAGKHNLSAADTGDGFGEDDGLSDDEGFGDQFSGGI